MTIRQQQLSNQMWMIAVEGRLDQSQNPLLESKLTALLEKRPKKIIIDLTQTDYINSGGLRTLVAAWREAKRQEGNLVLCGLNARLHDIFSMVGFDKVFQIYPNSSAAQKAELA